VVEERSGVVVEVHAPLATAVTLTIGDVLIPLTRGDGGWHGEVPDGERYGIIVDGPPRSGADPSRTLVDPSAREVWFPADHARDAARPGRPANHHRAPLAVARQWPDRSPGRRTTRPLAVYEAHVRGMTKRRERPDAGNFSALADELPRLAALGISVLELLPVHQFDPDEGNYWGYMPLVFGAVHRQYAAAGEAPEELAELVRRAHAVDIEIWLDVVFNHTTEEDRDGPTYNLRSLADGDYYVLDPRGGYVDEAGTGNMVDATTAPSQRLISESLDRFADLGVDGFRVDLATVLARSPAFIRRLGDWAERRSVRMIAEPWDLVRHQVGRSFPDRRWMQWNDRFRDDMRGFLRGEPGLVPAVMERLTGSADLFDEPMNSVNFLTAHDGFTLYDLVSYDHKHNEANGWDGADGSDDNRSWNCGWEGDEGVPVDVERLRRRQMRNALCLLLLGHGVPMIVAGDEFARTQRGNNNAYNQDNEISWVDWTRRERFAEQEQFVRRLLEFRARHPVLSDREWWGERLSWFGVDGPPDLSHNSRSIGWSLPGLSVMANMWWEPLTMRVDLPGRWWSCIDTASTPGFVEPTEIGPTLEVGPRSIVVLTTEVFRPTASQP
jgi:glycogen operon protein